MCILIASQTVGVRLKFDTACGLSIGVNAAGVAWVATPPIFDLQGSSCVDDPLQLGTNWYFYKVYHTTTIHGTHES